MRLAALPALALVLAAAGARAQTPGGVAAGEAIFQDRCTLCHGPAGGGQGPSLEGVVGRKAGALAGFSYSPALAVSGLTWTPATLDTFLAGPSALVPGTAMRAVVADPAERRDLIAYLASLRRP